MIKMFNIKLNKKGFTLMELVVSTAIMGTLAAFAVPAMLETQQGSKKAKTVDNINIIGAAAINKYMEVAPNGSASGGAIAAFESGLSLVSPLVAGTPFIVHSTSPADTVYYRDLFPPGKLPVSPFGQGYRVSSVTSGAASFVAGELVISSQPLITVQDVAETGLKETFKP